MDVSILSMQRVQNFGSLLQSFALKTLLESLDCRVSFLDIEPREADNALLSSRQASSGEGEPCGTFLSKLRKLDRYFLNRVRIKLRSRQQNVLFEEFRKDILGIGPYTVNENCDLCVIGSDEVFNCLSPSPWGFTGQLFGDIPQAKKVITYAASCGSTRLNQVPESVARRISEAFRKISAFSVRDRNTYEFASALAKGEIQEHLDPVAVTDFSAEMEKAALPAGLPKRYCVVYSYYNRICEQEDIRQIRAFCKQKGLAIIAVGAPQKWIRNYPVTNPFSMLKIFENAEFVITDTFHGTIFSAKYAKRFAVMVRDSNCNKLGDLIERLSIENHRVVCFGELDRAYAVQKNHAIHERLLRERERTLHYLRENIEALKK